MYDSIVNTLILVCCIAAVYLDYYILKYVKGEYMESRALNTQLSKIYKKTKRKKINADKIIKAAISQEVQS